jgi:hypothetical protein
MRIIYEGIDLDGNATGVVGILKPMDEFLDLLTGSEFDTLEKKLIYTANKDLPTGTKYEIIADEVDLSDRTFRNAWEYTTGAAEKVSADLTAEQLAKHNKKENL